MNKVVTMSFMLGTVVKLLRGLKRRKVLKTDMFCMNGSFYSRLVITTRKSSQFQASLRYVLLPNIKPIVMILINASIVNATVNTISV